MLLIFSPEAQLQLYASKESKNFFLLMGAKDFLHLKCLQSSGITKLLLPQSCALNCYLSTLGACSPVGSLAPLTSSSTNPVNLASSEEFL